MDNRLSNALQYAEKGWPVFPVGETKLPAVKGWEKAATADKEQIRHWFEEAFLGGCNFGFCPGRAGIAVIDTDCNKNIGGKVVNGEDSLGDFLREHEGTLPETFTVRTPSGIFSRLFTKNRRGKKENFSIRPSDGYRLGNHWE